MTARPSSNESPRARWFPAAGATSISSKQEVQRRADRNMPPLGGIAPEDARAALSQITSLDREEWALAFSAVAERHLAAGAVAGRRKTAPRRPRHTGRPGGCITSRAGRRRTRRRNSTPGSARSKLSAAYAALLDPPIETVRIPFEGKEIIAYLRLPPGVRPAPLVFGIAGLDSRKEDVAAHTDGYLKQGLGLFAIDLPGTGESPHAAADVDSDRIFSAALDYLAQRPDVDAGRIVVQGRSWSGYWAAKLAITERERLRGSVMHGGPIHHYFQPDWLTASLATGEYLYDYLQAKCAMHGASGLDDLLASAQRFSLLEPGCSTGPPRRCCSSTAPATRRSRLPTCTCCSSTATPRRRGSTRRAGTWAARRIGPAPRSPRRC